MKWIFYAMLLVNLGFLAWRLNYAAPPPPQLTTQEESVAGNVDRLLLLSEFDAKSLRERRRAPPSPFAENSPVAEPVADTQVPTPTEPMCFSVGPLSSPDDVERIGAWLASQGGEASLRESERREISVFWVYFPPFPSREEALEFVARMQANEIEDIYVIRRGDMANAISVGIYSQRASTQRRLSELRGKGYEPSILPRYKTKQAAWYDARFPDGYEFPEGQFAEAFPEIEAASVRCG